MNQWLAVAMGGAAGAVVRYAVTLWLHRGWFPWGTLAVNLTGCLLLGMLAEWSQQQPAWSPDLQKALSVGFLGALTTFSTFAHETVRMLEADRPWAALANVAVQLTLGLAAAALGIALVRRA